jgi:hypothetical protein
MNTKVISELLALQRVKVVPNTNVVFSNLVGQWGGKSYAELSVLLAAYRAMTIVHQSGHWACKGDSFYGDHLLLERVYGEANGFIDQIAEKLVGLSGESLVDPKLQLMQMNSIFDACNFAPSMSEKDIIFRSLLIEQMVLVFTLAAITDLKENFILTQGLENFLQGLCDSAENRCYLLKQRLKRERLV